MSDTDSAVSAISLTGGPGLWAAQPKRDAAKPKAALRPDRSGIPFVKAILAAAVSPLILIGIWTLLSSSGLFSPEILVPPQGVWAALLELAQSGDLWQHLQGSLYRLVTGYGIGAVIGLVLGVSMGLSCSAEAYLHPTFQLIRQIPTLALIPVFIMVFGIGETVKIVLVAKATALPIALASFEGVRGIPRSYFDVARIYRIRPFPFFVKVVVPATVPPVLTGMRIALTRSWMVLVGAELLVADNGLGQMMEWGRQMFRIDIVLVGVVLTGLIGFALDKAFRLLEHRMLRWQHR